MSVSRYDAIIFDLGGVLIQLGGISMMTMWTNWETEELWRRWLRSQSVRRFESGQISAEQFGFEIVHEFALPVDADHFLSQFATWPIGAYPGAQQLLTTLSPSYKLGCLSNTNALHWGRIVDEMNLIQHLDFAFPSHLTGNLKPDPGAFEYVAERLAFSPQRILFLDDNQINVEGATSAGMVAFQVDGVDGASKVLESLDIL